MKIELDKLQLLLHLLQNISSLKRSIHHCCKPFISITSMWMV